MLLQECLRLVVCERRELMGLSVVLAYNFEEGTVAGLLQSPPCFRMIMTLVKDLGSGPGVIRGAADNPLHFALSILGDVT